MTTTVGVVGGGGNYFYRTKFLRNVFLIPKSSFNYEVIFKLANKTTCIVTIW